MTIAQAPHRSTEQRMAALEVAHRVRRARAELKRDLRTRKIDPADIVLDVPEWCRSMRLVDFLTSTPGVGITKASALMRKQNIGASKTLAGLTYRQRRAVVVWLDQRGTYAKRTAA